MIPVLIYILLIIINVLFVIILYSENKPKSAFINIFAIGFISSLLMVHLTTYY